MATYKIKWLENKNPDWKVLTQKEFLAKPQQVFGNFRKVRKVEKLFTWVPSQTLTGLRAGDDKRTSGLIVHPTRSLSRDSEFFVEKVGGMREVMGVRSATYLRY